MMTLHVDAKQLEMALAPLTGMPKEIRGALWQSVKRSLDTMKTQLASCILNVSYLGLSEIRKAITKPQMFGQASRGQGDTVMGQVRVSGRLLPMDKFELVPHRPTAQKGDSRTWEPAGFQIGPREPVRHRQDGNGYSAGFVLRGKKGLMFFQSKWGTRRRYDTPSKSRSKRKYPNGYTNYALVRAVQYHVQYFAAFKQVHINIEKKAKERFESVLAHEVQYRLSKLGGAR